MSKDAVKELVIYPNELKDLHASVAVIDAFRWLFDNMPKDDSPETLEKFASALAARREQMNDLWEFKCYSEKLAEFIKKMFKASANAANAANMLPEFMHLSKESYTYEFKCEGSAALVAHSLIEKGMCTDNDLYNGLTASALAKAAGVKPEKLVELYPEDIGTKPKERTLTVK